MFCTSIPCIISGIVRHNQVCTEAFVKIKDVFQGLKNILEKSESQLKAKASFLVSYLYSHQRSIGGTCKLDVFRYQFVFVITDADFNYFRRTRIFRSFEGYNKSRT